MRKEPICEFKDEQEFIGCAQEWCDILPLDGWTIKFKLVDELFDEETGAELSGQCRYLYEKSTAIIKIVAKDNNKGLGLVKRFCAEESLVHELLHLLIDVTNFNSPYSYEGEYHKLNQHQLLDRLATSMLKVRYNLTDSWFCTKEGMYV